MSIPIGYWCLISAEGSKNIETVKYLRSTTLPPPNSWHPYPLIFLPQYALLIPSISKNMPPILNPNVKFLFRRRQKIARLGACIILISTGRCEGDGMREDACFSLPLISPILSLPSLHPSGTKSAAHIAAVKNAFFDQAVKSVRSDCVRFDDTKTSGYARENGGGHKSIRWSSTEMSCRCYEQ